MTGEGYAGASAGPFERALAWCRRRDPSADRQAGDDQARDHHQPTDDLLGVQRLAEEDHGQQLVATPMSLHFPELAARKAAAASAYASQLALFTAEQREDLRTPERYWQLQCDETG